MDEEELFPHRFQGNGESPPVQQAEASGHRRHHLLIAGTGRAGTSVLVRYLTGLGLETHLSRHGAASWYSKEAEAGFEDILLSAVAPDSPYVVKSPWSYQFAQEMLDDPGITLDAVIVPVRDLVEAAASRSIRELQGMHEALPWMAQVARTWEHWGMTPGGAVYSLSPVDIARLLAVGFHRLIERLVQADVPIVLLAFPRFAADPDYLYRKLAPVLPVAVPAALAREVHEATFHVEKVRVGHELEDAEAWQTGAGEVRGPSLAALEGAALKREVTRLREQLRTAITERDRVAEEQSALAAERQSLVTARDVLVDERDALVGERDQMTVERTLANNRLAAACLEKERERDERARLAREILALHASRSWRITRPLRALGRLARVLV